MVIQSELLGNLKDFGLNSYEAKLWTALLSRGVSTAGELSDIADVPRSRSYDVLESLEKKGFIIMKLGKPIKYIAVPPTEVIERIKKQVKENADKQSQVLDKLKKSTVIKDLMNIHTKGISLVEPSELTGLLKGRNNIYNHLQSMIKNAKKSVMIISTEEGIVRKGILLKNTLKKVTENGIDVKIITQFSKNNKKIISTISDYAQIRNCSDITARICVVDGKQAVVMMLDDQTHPNFDFGVWSNSEFFAKSIQSIFNQLWKNTKK